jgi:hypothetical protein
MVINVAQINTARSEAAMDQLWSYSLQNSVDLVLIQEPYAYHGHIDTHGVHGLRVVAHDKDPWAAIVVANPRLGCMALKDLCSENFAVAVISDGGTVVVCVSAYFRYDQPTSLHVDRLNWILGSLEGEHVIIGGDMNARSLLWHEPTPNIRGQLSRGDLIEELIDTRSLSVVNIASQYKTFVGRYRGEVNLDVTLVTPSMVGKVVHWTVLPDLIDSDHRLITYEIRKIKVTSRGTLQTGPRRYLVKKADWNGFQRALASEKAARGAYLASGDVNVSAEAITQAITAACETSIPIKKPGSAKPPTWWTDTLNTVRQELQRARRQLRRSRGGPTEGENWESVRRLRNQYLGEMRKAKRNSWRKFVTDIGNEDPWGPVYKWSKRGGSCAVVTPVSLQNADGSFTRTLRETGIRLLEVLVPQDDDTRESQVQKALRAETGIIGVGEVHLLPTELGEYDDGCTTAEVRHSLWKMKPNKSPGMDGLTGTILRRAWNLLSRQITDLFNASLRSGTFPETWRNAVVVVIPKPGKNPLEARSYRPISLLPVLSKALEYIVCSKIRAATESRLSSRQYGYTQGRSTVDAINRVLDWSAKRPEKYVIGIFLDISGAFDNLWWPALVKDMRELGCPEKLIKLTKSYLHGRTANLWVGDVRSSTVLTRGCPQGSCYGPDLWRYAVNGLLSRTLPLNTEIIAYADDLALLIASDTIDGIEKDSECVLSFAADWAAEHKLEFSTSKSQALALKGKMQLLPELRLCGQRVEFRPVVKYLGVSLQENKKFNTHIHTTVDRTAELFSKIRSITQAEWGLTSETNTKIYNAVYVTRIGYAPSVWVDSALRFKQCRKWLLQSQRRPLLCITKAYRTASTEALQVLAGILPIDLELSCKAAVERTRLAEKDGTAVELCRGRREEAWATAHHQWQARWSASEKGRWTERWFPCIETRLKRTWIKPDHYVSQLVTGHGDFRASLHRFSLAENEECECGAESDSAEHFIFECPCYDQERQGLRSAMGVWPCDPAELTSTSEAFKAMREFARTALRKRMADRANVGIAALI